MENLNILSVGGFSFFLLIIVIGYFFVEIIFGEKYFFRNSIKRNNNSIFDRFLHYFVWGIILNIIFIGFHLYSRNIESFLNLFNISGPLASEIDKQFGSGGVGFQIIYFVLFYFIVFLILSIIIFITIKIMIFFYHTFTNFDKIIECFKKCFSFKKSKK